MRMYDMYICVDVRVCISVCVNDVRISPSTGSELRLEKKKKTTTPQNGPTMLQGNKRICIVSSIHRKIMYFCLKI